MRRTTLEGEGARGGPELPLGGQRIDEAQAQRLVGAQRPTGEHELHRRLYADQLNAADRPAESRVNAELHLGQPERQSLIAHGDTKAAGERELQSPAGGKAWVAATGRAGRGGSPGRPRWAR